MPKPVARERKSAFYQGILKLKTEEECKKFFEDICSISEMIAIEQRFEVGRMLVKDRPYTEIIRRTSASSATISRVNRVVNYGTGVLRQVLEDMQEDEMTDASAKELPSAASEKDTPAPEE